MWDDLTTAVEPVRKQLTGHPVYYAVEDDAALAIFMEHHVWAVWDFMSLVTRLQRDITCVTVPWLPPATMLTEVLRFVNEIKLGEESDEDPRGGWTSHFDLYLDAMIEADADRGAVERTIAWLRDDPAAHPVTLARKAGAPDGVLRFISTTFGIVRGGALADVAGAFALGREEIIPDLFRPLVGGATPLLADYLARHITLDGDAHGPMARLLVEEVCGDDPAAWAAAQRGAMAALQARRTLWDTTFDAITRGPR